MQICAAKLRVRLFQEMAYTSGSGTMSARGLETQRPSAVHAAKVIAYSNGTQTSRATGQELTAMEVLELYPPVKFGYVRRRDLGDGGVGVGRGGNEDEDADDEENDDEEGSYSVGNEKHESNPLSSSAFGPAARRIPGAIRELNGFFVDHKPLAPAVSAAITLTSSDTRVHTSQIFLDKRAFCSLENKVLGQYQDGSKGSGLDVNVDLDAAHAAAMKLIESHSKVADPDAEPDANQIATNKENVAQARAYELLGISRRQNTDSESRLQSQANVSSTLMKLSRHLEQSRKANDSYGYKYTDDDHISYLESIKSLHDSLYSTHESSHSKPHHIHITDTPKRQPGKPSTTINTHDLSSTAHNHNGSGGLGVEFTTTTTPAGTSYTISKSPNGNNKSNEKGSNEAGRRSGYPEIEPSNVDPDGGFNGQRVNTNLFTGNSEATKDKKDDKKELRETLKGMGFKNEIIDNALEIGLSDNETIELCLQQSNL